MEKPLQEKTLYWPLGLKFWEFGKKYGQGSLKDGLRHGPWVFRYRSGNKQMAGDYKNGRKHGTWTHLWENGQIISQGEFLNGQMHGTWTDGFENGQKAQQTQWDNGRPCGETLVYDRDSGQVKDRLKCDPDKEEAKSYTLMTDRDMAFAVQQAQKARIQAAWSGLVGQRVSRVIQPWQGTLWLLLLIPAFGLLQPKLDILAVPAAAVAASMVSVALIILTRLHDKMTRADLGTSDQQL